MNKRVSCNQAIESLIETYPGGGLPADVAGHIGSCPDCRKETAMIKKTMEMLDKKVPGLEEAQAGIDWEALADRVTDNVFREARPVRTENAPAGFFGKLLARPSFRPVFAGLAAGLILGSVAMYLALKGSSLKVASSRPAGPSFYASAAYLDRLEDEAARAQVVEYLEKSGFILRDISSTGVKAGPGDIEAGRAAVRDLLNKKRYLNPQLEGYRMAKAKAICDQIEALFQELLQENEAMSAAEVAHLREIISERNLLLKINIVKKEIQGEA